jgi:hypothetical protein
MSKTGVRSITLTFLTFTVFDPILLMAKIDKPIGFGRNGVRVAKKPFFFIREKRFRLERNWKSYQIKTVNKN